MKKITWFFLASALAFSSLSLSAQDNAGINPYSFDHEVSAAIPLITMPAHDFAADIAYAEAFEKEGNYPLFARHFAVDKTLLNAGTWTRVQGGRVWQLQLRSAGALSSALFFDNTFLPAGSILSVYSPDRSQHFVYTHENNQGNMLLSTEFIRGEEQILEYYEPLEVQGQGMLHITEMSHQYRSIMADPCEVNIVCTPENVGWTDEEQGICRIYVVGPSGAGYCSGTLINNTALDCKRYILTALHCGEASTATHLNSWVFRFNFEATMCTGQPDTYGTSSNQFTGCVRRSDSGDGGGSTGSDFLLVELSATSSPTWWSGVYFNGWTRSTTATAGGVGIHHPAGSNKKISTFTSTPLTTSWGISGTHWRIVWTATTNGHGVTEGGSSGSPVFNSAGLVFGTLTGGSSYCTSPTSPDAYGKMSYHWTSNGATAALQLKPWLDPINSNVTTLNGSYSPCGLGIADQAVLDQLDVNVYPNPGSGVFSVSTELAVAGDIHIRAFNAMGQEIINTTIENTSGGTMELDLSAQPAGIYFVHVQSGGKVSVKKLQVLSSK